MTSLETAFIKLLRKRIQKNKRKLNGNIHSWNIKNQNYRNYFAISIENLELVKSLDYCNPETSTTCEKQAHS